MKSSCAFILVLVSFIARAQIPAVKVTVFDSSLTTGYYFLSVGSNNLILDRFGNVIYYNNAAQGGSFCLHANGLMSYGNGTGFYLMDSTFTIVDTVELKNLDENDFHEFQILPNGHFVLLGQDIEIMDLSSYYWKGHYGNDSAEVRCGVIQEQDANHNVVFEWHTKDHFSFTDADTFNLNNGPVVRWTHCNAIELDTDGNYLLSSRNFNEITKINRSDSSIMWRLGGNQNEFTFINSSVPFYLQHDIRRIGNGNITLFDNGNHYTPHAARGLEFALDETNKTATLAWSYSFDSASVSLSQGNMQRLNGSRTLINIGACPTDSVSFVVVDSMGSRIFELDDANIYRAYNYDTLPWQLHRPQIMCFDSLGVTYLDAGAGYTSYLWNNGATTQIIPVPAVIDTYYVFVPYGHNGFISSEIFMVYDPSDICAIATVFESNPDVSQISVFPNPASNQINVVYDLPQASEVYIYITDISGRIIEAKNAGKKAGKNFDTFDFSNTAPGFYLFRINEQTVKIVRQQ